MMANKTRLGWSNGPSPYWVVKLSHDTQGDSGSPALHWDGTDFWVRNYDLSPAAGYLAKLTEDGETYTDQEYTAGGTSVQILNLTVDGSSMFAACELAGAYFGILELDPSDFSIDLQREILATVVYPMGIAIDSSDNIYSAYYASGNGPEIIKTNSSGVFQWGYSVFAANPGGGVLRSYIGDDNLYIVVMDETVESIEVLKISSATPAITWQRKVTIGGGIQTPSIEVDASGNVYVLIEDSSPSPNDVYLFKWNSSGTLQWQVKIDSGSNDITAQGTPNLIAVDSSDNVYVGVANTTGDDVVVIKLNSSGVAQWQKSLKYSTATSVICNGVYTDDTYVYVGMLTSPGHDMYICKLSVEDDVDFGIAHEITVDGASPFTVATSSKTEAVGTITLSASSPTVQATSNTISAAGVDDWYDYDSRERL